MDFKERIRNAYKDATSDLHYFELWPGQFIVCAVIKDSQEDALEVHFVANWQSKPMMWATLYNNTIEWKQPPEPHPIGSRKMPASAFSDFIPNNELFGEAVYMIQYRLYDFKKTHSNLTSVEFIVYDGSGYKKDVGGQNYKVKIT